MKRPSPTGSPTSTAGRSTLASSDEEQALKRWIVLGALAGYVVVLLLLALLSSTGPHDQEGLGLWRLRTGSAIDWLKELVRERVLDFLKFIPVGALAALVFRRRDDLLERLLLIVAPAALLSLFVAWLVQSVEIGRPLRWTGVLPLLAPVAGALVGTWMGLEWRRGPRARLWILPKVLIVAGSMALVASVVYARATESKPFPFEIEHVTSVDKSTLYDKFRGKGPEQVAEAETEVIRLTQRQANQLLSWAFALAREERRARVEFQEDRLRLLASVGVSGEGADRRYLNISLSGRVWMEEGVPNLHFDSLMLGPLVVPDLLVEASSKVFDHAVRADRNLLSMRGPLREIRFHDAAVELKYGHGKLPQGFAHNLFSDEGPMGDVASSLQDQVTQLVRAAPHLPGGEARLGAAIETAFSVARRRADGGDSVMENQAALLALAVVSDIPGIEPYIGQMIGQATRENGKQQYRALTLRDRADWSRHFLASAAIRVLTTLRPAEASRLREALETSDAGAGISFGRIMADIAGTRFADLATRDPGSAEGLERRLIGGFHVEDYFPEGVDLPEDVDEQQLGVQYGCAPDVAYAELLAEVSRRVAESPGYRY